MPFCELSWGPVICKSFPENEMENFIFTCKEATSSELFLAEPFH